VRILFAASPAIAVPCLNALCSMELDGTGIVLAGILTNPDRPHKHGHSEPTDISRAALHLDTLRRERGLDTIPQLKPETLNEDARGEVAALKPDVLVSVAYGSIFGPRFLALFKRGAINIHPSLLPKYRGATPIPAAILAQDTEAGISIQKLALKMDEGDILLQERFPLSLTETTLSLSETVAEKSAKLLTQTLLDFDSYLAAAAPQTGEASYCSRITKADGQIDWTKSALAIDAHIRAYTPAPLSFTSFGKTTLLILEAAPFYGSAPSTGEQAAGTVLGTDKGSGVLIQTGDGILAVSRLQLQAKKALDWRAFCNGVRDFIGVRLGS